MRALPLKLRPPFRPFLPRSVREKQEQEKAAAAETGGVAAIAPTTTLLLTAILPAGQLRTESERRIVSA